MFIRNKYTKNNVITYKGDKIIIQGIFQRGFFNKLICLTSYIFGTDLFNLYMYEPERTPKNPEKIPDYNRSGVYKLNCKTCNMSYIGQTSRT